MPEHRKKSSEPHPLSEKIRTRKRAERRRFARRIMILVGIVALIAGAGWVLFYSSLFAVKAENISVTVDDPSGLVDEARVTEIVAQSEGTPVLRLNSGELEGTLESIPEIESATVAGAFPTGIDVSITAREAVACVGSADSCVGIAADATQLEITDELRGSLPRLTIDLDSERAEQHLDGLLLALDSLPDSVRAQVDSVSVSSSGLIEFDTGEATIKWGASEQNEKKARIIEILLTESARTYDVTVPDAPVTY